MKLISIKNKRAKIKKFYPILVIRINRYALIVTTCVILILFMATNTVATFKRQNILASKIVVIDPGHGGIDGGTHDKLGLLEKNINLDVALRVKRYLEHRGITVVMTREEDIALDSKSDLNISRHSRDLHARKTIIEDANGHVFVSIHVNCITRNPMAKGVIIFYSNKAEESKILAQSLVHSTDKFVNNEYLKNPSLRAKLIEAGSYYLLNTVQTPGVIYEMGFITNAEEKVLLQKDEYQESIAQAIAEGIIKYLISK